MAKKNNPKPSAEQAKPIASKPERQLENPATTAVSPFYIRWMPALLFLLAFLLYAPTIGHQYAFDDSIVITKNQFTQQGFKGIGQLMSRDFFDGIYGNESMNLTGGRYRPLSLVMFAIEYQFFGLNPAVGHFVNVLLYALSIWLLFKVLSRWFGKDSVVPLAASLLFLVHPIHSEVVANIKSRDEIIALLLLLCTFQSLHHYTEKKKIGWLISACLAFFGAALSKESAFTFLVIIPLSMWVFENKTKAQIGRASLLLVSTGIAYLALRTAMVGKGGGAVQSDLLENPLYGTSTSEFLGTVAVIVLKYWQLLFAPYPLSADYSFNQIPRAELSSVLAIISIAAHLSLAAFILWKLPKKNVFAWAAVAVLVPLSPTINLFFNIGAPLAERFLYLPSLGFVVAMGYGFSLLSKQVSLSDFLKKPMWMGLLLLISIAASVLTFARSKAWYNNETLFAADVQTVPNSAKIHYYYGNTFLEKFLALNPKEMEAQKAKLLPVAEKEAARAVEIYPQFHTGWYTLGLAYYHQSKTEKALESWNKALDLAPGHILSLKMMAQLHARYLNQPDKSLEFCRKLVEEAKITKDGDIWQTMGIAYAMKNEPDKALVYMQKAIDAQPKNADFWANMGAIYGNSGNPSKAQECINKANSLR